MKMICLTYAGGNTTFFNQLKNELQDSVEVVALEYAGHGTRNKEPFYKNFDELADDMLDKMKHIIQGDDYALLGYSMGSISAVEMLNKILKDENMNPPKRVFLGAHEPYTKLELANYDSAESDELVKQRTIMFGGVSERLINNKSFWRVYLPIYKADYALIGRFNFDELELKTDIPVTVFYSQSDTPLEVIQDWKKFFIGECEFLEYTGGHFFINEHCGEIADAIKGRLVNNNDI